MGDALPRIQCGLDVLPVLVSGDSNPSQRLCGRRELRFTVRRPPSGEVSPCSHRPPSGDVSCSVHIRGAPADTADFAPRDRLALAVFWRDVPIYRTVTATTDIPDRSTPASLTTGTLPGLRSRIPSRRRRP